MFSSGTLEIRITMREESGNNPILMIWNIILIYANKNWIQLLIENIERLSNQEFSK